jgi:hypothetical protein
MCLFKFNLCRYAEAAAQRRGREVDRARLAALEAEKEEDTKRRMEEDQAAALEAVAAAKELEVAAAAAAAAKELAASEAAASQAAASEAASEAPPPKVKGKSVSKYLSKTVFGRSSSSSKKVSSKEDGESK